MRFSWNNLCALSVVVLAHLACEVEHPKRVPEPATESVPSPVPAEPSQEPVAEPAPEPAKPTRTEDEVPKDGPVVTEKDGDAAMPTVTEHPTPKTEATPVPTPDESKNPSGSIGTNEPARPPVSDPIEVIIEDLGRAIAEAEAVLKFQKEFDQKHEPWLLDLRKSVALLNGGFYQTVKAYKRPELMKSRDELTTFVNSSTVDEKTKTNAREHIASNYDQFEVLFNSRGSAATEFSNLTNSELKRLSTLCKNYPETVLSCEVIHKLAALKTSFFKMRKWPESSFLIYETLIFDLGKAPLNDEQLATAEKFHDALQADQAAQ